MNENELYEASLKLLKPLSVSLTYKTIVDEAIKLVNGGGGSLILAKKGLLKRVYSTDPQVRSVNPQKYGRTYRVYRDQKVMTLSRESIVEVHPEFSKIKINSYLLIPLINHGRSIGVLSIYKSKDTKFSQTEIGTLKQFSAMGSLAIRKAGLYQQVRNALSLRDLFMAMASHELKTPATTMYVYMQLLKRRLKKGESLDPEWINTLLYEMTRLTKLIDELLQVGQIRAGKFNYEFEEVDVVEMVKRTLSSFRTSHKNAKIILHNKIGKEFKTIADPDKLTQVIINLLDNSAKHNQWEEPIFLKLSLVKRVIKISVEDNGTGIPNEDLKHLFDEFYKGKGHTKSGMGLGLFLVKTIIDKHKGKIKIRSKPGKGTKIDVFLPAIDYD